MNDSNGRIASLLDDDDVYNIIDIENAQPFIELRNFLDELKPEYLPIIDNLLEGKDINANDFQKVLVTLSEILVPLYNRDGTIDDPKMTHLYETLVAVGRQL